MLDHQINSLFDGGIDEIIVVLGHQKDLLLPMLQHYKSVIPIYNRDYLSGKATSIKSGLSKINKLNRIKLLKGCEQAIKKTLK